MTRTRRFIIGGICALALLGMLLLAVWTANAYREMRRIQTGTLWRLPTRVYAAPFELSPGMDIARAGLTERLAHLRYRRMEQAGSPGQYSTTPGRMVIRRRRFVDAHGDHPSARVELDLEGSRIRRVLSGDSRQEVSSARIEPECIATLYDGGYEDREIVSLKDCPPVLIDALLSVEDRRFREHPGIDVRAMARALLADLFSARVVEGGSTITQQLVKNLFLSHERTLGRKLKEAWLALIMETAFTKDEILALYLNEIYLGRSGYAGIHGFARASRLFFDKEVSSLDLHEAALLAGIVRSPNRYSPYTHPKAALDRRNTVLTLMHDQGRVSSRSCREALKKPLGVVPFTPAVRQAPYFVDYVVSALRRMFPGEEGAVTSGLNVYTTLDMHAQRTAEDAVRRTVASMPARVQAAVVVLRPSTGEILAMVGGRDYRVSQFNRAASARRSIGSLIKPMVYYTALRNGYALSSLVEDTPVSVPLPDGSVWSPVNYDGRSHGEVLLVDGLAFSHNQATVRLGLDVGLDRVVAEAKKVMPQTRVPAHPSVLLGAVDCSPLDVALMYAVFAGRGMRPGVSAITAVLDGHGAVLHSAGPNPGERVLDEGATYLVSAALREAMRRGTARAAHAYGVPAGVCGKTGTTNDLRDSWFAAYTEDVVTVAWMGDDSFRSIGLSGAQGALPVAARIMARIASPAVSHAPEGIAFCEVDPVNGKRATAWTASPLTLPFIAGTQPEQESTEGMPGLFKVLRSLFRFDR